MTKLKLTLIQAFNSIADALSSSKTVLPWVMQATGAPTVMIGMVVPIRESLSMLPQVLLSGWVNATIHTHRLYALGFFVQALCMLAIIASMLLLNGAQSGSFILLFITLAALGRCLTSLTAKQVVAQQIKQGERGQLLGIAGSLGGLVSCAAGVALLLALIERDSAQNLLAISCVMWLLASTLVLTLSAKGSNRQKSEAKNAQVLQNFTKQINQSVQLLKQDEVFRNFVITRALMVSSSLCAPFLVLLALGHATDDTPKIVGQFTDIEVLGALLLVSGLAQAVSGTLWGKIADRRSQSLIRITGLLTAAICMLAGIVSCIEFSSARIITFSMALFFSLHLIHQGVRIARKTYVIDIADDEQRTEYVATSNSIIGVLLLVMGGVSSLVAQWSLTCAFGLLALLALLGSFYARTLPKVIP